MLRTMLLVLSGLCLLVGQASAQPGYPVRPVRIVVPSPPGGGTDIIARVLAQHSRPPSASNSSSRTGRVPAT